MAESWNQRTSESSDGQSGAERDGLKMIPVWSILLAVLVFVGWLYFSYYAQPHHHGPQPMRLLMVYMTGTVLASYVLLVGYVSRDVKRRNMPALLWMLIVVVMPGGIGAVVYFLLRQPVMIRCPNCSTELTCERPLLSAVQVSGGPGVRAVLPRSADYRCVLSAVRARRLRGRRPGAAARLQRQIKVAGCQLQGAS